MPAKIACMCLRRQVQCGGEVFEMHASVVTCGSEYFRAMLERSVQCTVEEVSGRTLLLNLPPFPTTLPANGATQAITTGLGCHLLLDLHDR